MLWLGRGIAGDDTHGHIDDVARFVNESTIVASPEPNPDDVNHRAAEGEPRPAEGRPGPDGVPTVVPGTPDAPPDAYDEQRVPASYINFYIANGVVLVPTFNDPASGKPCTLAASFPGRTVRGIHCGDLIWGLGTINFLTQQEPAA